MDPPTTSNPPTPPLLARGFKYQPGARPLDGYTIKGAAGRGGFGEVYYAVSDSGREVALKSIQGYDQIELRGIKHCMNLKSPHLVTIFDIRFNEANEPFVLMEYVGGPSLRQIIDESPGGLGVAKASYFLREIAKGLSYLHEAGVVHRDLKPANIFYDQGYVKIGDYGLSKAIGATQYSGHTVTVGTVHYMAPEIGEGRYDQAIDIYALGILFYELLTGQVPYLGSTPGEILLQHVSKQPDLTGIDEPMRRVIAKAIAKDPAERYPTVQAMIEDLFGTEHIRQSVSHFSPESLSVHAVKAVQDSPVLAEQSGPPAASGAAPTPATLEQRIEAVGDRIAQTGDRVGDQIDARLSGHRDSQHSVLRDTLSPELTNRLERHARRLDPVFWPVRLLLSVGVAVVFGFGMAAVMNDGEPGLVAALLIAAVALGAVIAHRLTRPLLRDTSPVIQRLGFAVIALLPAFLIAGPPGFHEVRGFGPALLCMVAAMTLIGWYRQVDPLRENRLALGPTIAVAGTGWIGAWMIEADPTWVLGCLAGCALATQALCAFVPHARRNPQDAERATPRPIGARPVVAVAELARQDQTPPRDTTAETEPRGTTEPSESTDDQAAESGYSRTLASVLAGLPLLGIPVFGLHRFYVGKIGTGVLWLLTFGLLGIGQLVDFIVVLAGGFNDQYGLRLLDWSGRSASERAQRHEAHSNTRSRRASRRRRGSDPWSDPSHITSAVLSFLAALVLISGLLTGLAYAIDVPGIVRSGMLGVDFAERIKRDLGDAGWHMIAEQIIGLLWLGQMLIAATLLIVARRWNGPWHMVRAVAGVAALGIAVMIFSDGLGPGWPSHHGNFFAAADSAGIQQSLQHALNRAQDALMPVSFMSLMGVVLLAWPPHRPSTTNPQGA